MIRRRKDTIEFISVARRAAEQFPPVPAGACSPAWFKKSPLYKKERRFPNLRLKEDMTIRACPGISDYLNLGWMVPLWDDYLIEASADGYHSQSSGSCDFSAFPPDKWPHFPLREHDSPWAVRMESPWRIRTPKGWSVMILPPWYHRDDRFSVMPGVVDTDRYSLIAPIVLWHVPIGTPTLVKAGTPFIQIVPYRRGGLQPVIQQDVERWKQMNDDNAVITMNRIAPGSYKAAGECADA